MIGQTHFARLGLGLLASVPVAFVFFVLIAPPFVLFYIILGGMFGLPMSYICGWAVAREAEKYE